MVESAKTGRGGFSAELQQSALRLNNACRYLRSRPSSTYAATRTKSAIAPLFGTLPTGERHPETGT